MSNDIAAIKNVVVNRQPLRVTFFQSGSAEVHDSNNGIFARFNNQLAYIEGAANKRDAFESLAQAAAKCTERTELKQRVSDAASTAGIGNSLVVS